MQSTGLSWEHLKTTMIQSCIYMRTDIHTENTFYWVYCMYELSHFFKLQKHKINNLCMNPKQYVFILLFKIKCDTWSKTQQHSVSRLDTGKLRVGCGSTKVNSLPSPENKTLLVLCVWILENASWLWTLSCWIHKPGVALEELSITAWPTQKHESYGGQVSSNEMRSEQAVHLHCRIIFLESHSSLQIICYDLFTKHICSADYL